MALPETDYVFVPVDQLTSPPEGHVDHLGQRWWMVHPEKGLAFYNPHRRSGHGNPYGSPQCNSNKKISERLCQPWAEVRLIDHVFLPLKMQDYT
jgi:hypothetical protein